MGTTTIHQRVAPEARAALADLVAHSVAPDDLTVRARIVLAVLDGEQPAVVAGNAGLPRTTVYSWVRRFASVGVTGLAPRSWDGRTRPSPRCGRD